MATHVRSHAKINLGLYIGAPRADGFHGLTTVYQTLELFDVVSVTARQATVTAIRLTSNDTRVPPDERNTAWKMVALALESLGVAADVAIHIEKRLPVQGGLGAGSANAVAALVGLERELGIGAFPGLKGETWGTRAQDGPGVGGFPPVSQKARHGWVTPGSVPASPVSRKAAGDPSSTLRSAQDDSYAWEARRLEIAAQVGSDVPLFLVGGTVLGLDRGQEVYPLPDVEPTWCVIATPEMGVSTAQAFRDWDALCTREGLTQDASQAKLSELSRAYRSAFAEAIPDTREILKAGGVLEGQREAGSSGVLSAGENLAGPLESALVRTGITSWIVNDFERVVFLQHPSLAEIKRILAASGTPEAAIHASLSGSGSALFGLYLAQEHAVKVRERLEQAGVRSLLTRTLPRSEYWRDMLLKDED